MSLLSTPYKFIKIFYEMATLFFFGQKTVKTEMPVVTRGKKA